MTMVAIGGENYWPPLMASGGAVTGAALGLNQLTFDSTADRVAWVGRASFTDSIVSVQFRTGTVTTGCTMEIRIETVTNGRPSGTLWATTTNGTVVVANTDDNVWKTVTLTSAASLTPSQEFAIVMVRSAGTPNMLLVGLALGNGGAVEPAVLPTVLQDATGAGWAAPANGATELAWIVTLTTAGVKYIPGLTPRGAGATVTAFNSGSSPDEYALKLTVAATMRSIGAKVFVANLAAGADFSVSLWPASSSVDGDALGQISEDGDLPYATNTDGYVTVYWTTPVTLTAGTVYYIGVRADTANNLAFASLVAQDATSMPAFNIPTGGTMFLATRTWTAGTAGAWTETATDTLPVASLIIDQVDDGAGTGGGGGMVRIITGAP